MVSKFDDRVETAIDNIWFKVDASLVEESLRLLREAANMGDGDAYYFLGRCYMGDRFVNPSLNLPLDTKFAYECFDMSIGLESAVGMFGTILMDDFTPSNGNSFAPYLSKREVWNEVAKKAYSGNVFCKFLIANAYYYGYIADFKECPINQYEWDAAALKLYEECIEAGLGLAIPNVVELLSSGRNGESTQAQKAKEYIKLGADMGIGVYERMVGNSYRKAGNAPMALKMYNRALAHRDYYTYYYLGRLYTFNGIMELDLNRALDYFNKGYELFPDDYGFCNMLGVIYFYGGQSHGFNNIPKDYDKAFEYLNKANELGSGWGADLLGTCYLYGLGTDKDYDKARQLFESCPKKRLAVDGLEKLAKRQTE
jgi:hypothetical protein